MNKSHINKKQINFPILNKPEINELTKIGLECNKIIKETQKIIKSVTNPYYTINSKYFTNTEGSEILQNFTDTIIEMIATAHDSGKTQSVNITEGGRGGLELITNKAQQSAKNIAIKASELITAKSVKEETTSYRIKSFKGFKPLTEDELTAKDLTKKPSLDDVLKKGTKKKEIKVGGKTKIEINPDKDIGNFSGGMRTNTGNLQ